MKWLATSVTSRLRATWPTSGGYFEAAQKSSNQQAPENPPFQGASCQEAATQGSGRFTRVMWLPD